jgi:hypothetical protein
MKSANVTSTRRTVIRLTLLLSEGPDAGCGDLSRDYPVIRGPFTPASMSKRDAMTPEIFCISYDAVDKVVRALGRRQAPAGRRAGV